MSGSSLGNFIRYRSTGIHNDILCVVFSARGQVNRQYYRALDVLRLYQLIPEVTYVHDTCE
jgi:hypothetical protein